MKDALTRLRAKLGSDATYFHKVYDHTFGFARTEGQRSLGTHMIGPLDAGKHLMLF